MPKKENLMCAKCSFNCTGREKLVKITSAIWSQGAEGRGHQAAKAKSKSRSQATSKDTGEQEEEQGRTGYYFYDICVQSPDLFGRTNQNYFIQSEQP